MPSGPWGGRSGAVAGSSACGGDVQQLLLRPLAAGGSGSSGSSGPAIPLAEGRTVLGMVWLAWQRLLLLAAPLDDAAPGVEGGEGTVLIEVSVTLPDALATPHAPQAAGGSGSTGGKQGVQQQGSVCARTTVQLAAVRTSYAGGAVLAAATHPRGGAVLQLTDGRLLFYAGGSSGSSGSSGTSGGDLHHHQQQQQQQQQQQLPVLLPPAAHFPAPCPTMLLLPGAPLPPGGGSSAGWAAAASGSSGGSSANAPPAVGLSSAGVLCWGGRVVAGDVTSVAMRASGPGGPALLYTTRQSLLYVVMTSQLGRYTHTLVGGSCSLGSWGSGVVGCDWAMSGCVSATCCWCGSATCCDAHPSHTHTLATRVPRNSSRAPTHSRMHHLGGSPGVVTSTPATCGQQWQQQAGRRLQRRRPRRCTCARWSKVRCVCVGGGGVFGGQGEEGAAAMWPTIACLHPHV
jgi:hypothetical protein